MSGLLVSARFAYADLNALTNSVTCLLTTRPVLHEIFSRRRKPREFPIVLDPAQSRWALTKFPIEATIPALTGTDGQ